MAGPFFLQRIEIDFASDLNWPLVQNRVELSKVPLGLILDHGLAAGLWNAILDVNAVVSIDDVSLEVAGQLSVGDVSSTNLRVRAGARSGIAPGDALNRFIGAGTGAQLESQFELPSTTTLPDEDKDPFEAVLTLQKDASGCYLENASATLFWQQEYWYPTDGINISLQELYFEFIAKRELVPANENPSDMPLAFSAAFGGSITLYNIPMAVVITYQSKTTTTVLTCTVDDDASICLQDIAADSLLNPTPDPTKTPTPHDLNQEAQINQVPGSVPVDLTCCSSHIWGTQRFCILIFTASEPAQLQLKANFELDWQVTSQLTITGMGTYFDITNPTSSDKSSVIKGYAYGSVS